jgi:hypothetical protein
MPLVKSKSKAAVGPEHQNRDGGGQAPEAGSGDCPGHSAPCGGQDETAE